MILSDRLLMRPLEESDAPGIQRHWGDPEVTAHCGAGSDERLARAQRNLPVRYVEASFDPRNAASGRVLAKTGFTFREHRRYDDVQPSEPVHRLELRDREAQ